MLVAQSCPTIFKPMDGNLSGSNIHGTLQARILECVAFPFPEDLPDSEMKAGSPTLQADSFPSWPPGKPFLLSKGAVKLFIHVPEVIVLVWSGFYMVLYSFCPIQCDLKIHLLLLNEVY